MASLFGDDGVEDLFNDGINEDHQLPSDDEANNDNNDEDGKAEDPVKVEPKKRITRTRQKLSVETLQGARGIHTIENYFKDIKFKGKGNEKQDLTEVLKRLQHWGHRLYPNYKFNDILNTVERLGKKKTLHVHMSRYRLGMLDNLRNGNDDEIVEADEAGGHVEDEPFDEFDALLDEQIAISRLAPKTPGSISQHTYTPSSSLATPSFSRNAVASTPFSAVHMLDTSELAHPLPPSQPATPQLSSEQLARIAENRKIAQERLRAKKLERERQQLESMNSNDKG